MLTDTKESIIIVNVRRTQTTKTTNEVNEMLAVTCAMEDNNNTNGIYDGNNKVVKSEVIDVGRNSSGEKHN
ncbi:hypothetical protein PAV_141p00160 (plasmid) [Paenibacillus alvei DSM 29]|nr:hypothetical protein PAV_141p00160 [Paenibacillus alvei DSM 29]